MPVQRHSPLRHRGTEKKRRRESGCDGESQIAWKELESMHSTIMHCASGAPETRRHRLLPASEAKPVA
jgi:hypothetical protein